MILPVLSFAIWIFLLFGRAGFWLTGARLSPASPRGAPSTTIVIPARDEAPSIARCLRSLLAQNYPGPLQIILVDDGSVDGTGDIARALADPRLRVIDAGPRPEGWSGKLWALSRGVAATNSDLLFLTDADIEHQPAHLASLVAQLETNQLDMVSEMVALNCESFAERALVPAFVFFFALLYPFAQVNDPGSRTAAAAGGTVLIRRAALDAIGGLATLRGALIDDVTLAGLIKARGRIWLGHSALAASIRPYPHAADIWRMVARTAYVQLRFSPPLLAATVAGMILIYLVPPAATLLGHGSARLAGGLAWLAMSVSFVPTLRRFGQSLAWAPFLPLTAMFYTAATIGSAIDHLRGRGVVWKRRSYR